MSKEVEKNQVLTIENLSGSTLVNVTEWEQKINDVKEQNPIIEIIDNATYEIAKKKRTAVKTVRVEIDKQDKVIATAFSKVRKETMEIRDILLSQIEPFEEEHEAEVSKWEDKKKKEKEDREAAEQRRIDAIKAKVDEIETWGYSEVSKLTYKDIDEQSIISKMTQTDFDFQEFDILLTQAVDRVRTAASEKIDSLIKEENQRSENERLARQDERLQKLYPVLPFTQGVELMNLHTLSEESFLALLSDAIKGKEESDRKAKEAEAEAKRIADERAEKEREEKIKVFVIRKQRLLDLGMGEWATTPTGDNKDCISGTEKLKHFLIPDYEIYFNSIGDADTLSFEEIYNEAKEAIEKAKEEKQLKDRFYIRVNELSDMGFSAVDNGSNFHNEKYSFGFSAIDVQFKTDEDFDLLIEQTKTNFAQKDKMWEEARKASDKRQKALKKDKELIGAYVFSLEFRDAVPNVKNEESESLLKEVDIALSNFKDSIVELINNY